MTAGRFRIAAPASVAGQPQPTGLLAAAEGCFRVFDWLGPVFRFDVLQQPLGATAAAHGIDPQVAGYSVDPGHRARRGRIELVGLVPQRDHVFLCDLLRLGFARACPQQLSPDARGKELKQSAKGFAIPAQGDCRDRAGTIHCDLRSFIHARPSLAIDPDRLACPEICRCSNTVISCFPFVETKGKPERITGSGKIRRRGDLRAFWARFDIVTHEKGQTGWKTLMLLFGGVVLVGPLLGYAKTPRHLDSASIRSSVV